MNLYKVRVRCLYIEGLKAARPKRCWMTALIEARNSDEAFKLGEKYVEDRAPIGPKWLEFAALEVSSVCPPCLTAEL